MTELLIGLAAGLLIARRLAWWPEQGVLIGALLGVLLYFASCWVWPHIRPCPRCEGESTRRDGPGGRIYRRAPSCRACGGGDYVRRGARVLGRG